LPDCNSDWENAVIKAARGHLATYNDMAEMIRLGAYRSGTDPAVDEAIRHTPAIEDFLNQNKYEKCGIEETYTGLSDILGVSRDGAADETTGDAVQ